ncbi:MAG: hypothetical protein NTV22_05280 [bacterium]|nr:hypothetical protein [bacterium]
MKNTINRREFWQQLKMKHPCYDKYYWFTAALHDNADYAYYETKGDLSLESIACITKRVLRLIRAKYPLIMFPDVMCGWKNTERRNSSVPVRIDSIGQLRDIIDRHVYFRSDGGIENYYITDANLKWFIVLHHEGWWVFSAPWELGCRVEMAWNKRICPDGSLELCQPTRITTTVAYKRNVALGRIAEKRRGKSVQNDLSVKGGRAKSHHMGSKLKGQNRDMH